MLCAAQGDDSSHSLVPAMDSAPPTLGFPAKVAAPSLLTPTTTMASYPSTEQD